MNRPDPELIAKLLEGKASAAERRAVLESADADPEILALLADSAAMHESIAARPAWRRNATLYLIAAAVVFAVVLPVAMRARTDIPPFDSGSLDAKAVVAGALVGPARQTVRGEQSAERLLRSAELGARVTDLELLARTGDSSTVLVARELAAAAQAIPGGAAAASQLNALPAQANKRTRGDAIDALAALVDQPRFRAGKWAEATRLANAVDNQVFLRATGLQDAFERMARSPSLPQPARDAAARVASALAQRAGAPAIDQAVGAFFASLARE